MRKNYCSFCGREIEFGTGITYILSDGRTLHFCSSKCKKNMLVLKRDPRKLKWTLKYRKGGR
ncbi:MAG: 50S ribosomal protein L24e [Candidatus Asgardarchaeia archaeon]